MSDRCLFIQQEIECQIIDDFMLLPSSAARPEPFYRHCLYFIRHTYH